MWNGKRRRAAARVDTLVGEGTCVMGNVMFSGGLHVDGVVQGNVIADPGAGDAVVVLSEHGRIEGEVQAPHVIINGAVSGDVRAVQCVELAPRARVHGDIYYHRIEMAMGAEVNGQLVHMVEAESPRSLPAPEPAEVRTAHTVEHQPSS